MATAYIGQYTRPNGYFGDTTNVHLCLDGNKLIEVYQHGYHNSGFLPMDIQDTAEAIWLISNHPSSQYK